MAAIGLKMREIHIKIIAMSTPRSFLVKGSIPNVLDEYSELGTLRSFMLKFMRGPNGEILPGNSRGTLFMLYGDNSPSHTGGFAFECEQNIEVVIRQLFMNDKRKVYRGNIVSTTINMHNANESMRNSATDFTREYAEWVCGEITRIFSNMYSPAYAHMAAEADATNAPHTRDETDESTHKRYRQR